MQKIFIVMYQGFQASWKNHGNGWKPCVLKVGLKSNLPMDYNTQELIELGLLNILACQLGGGSKFTSCTNQKRPAARNISSRKPQEILLVTQRKPFLSIE